VTGEGVLCKIQRRKKKIPVPALLPFTRAFLNPSQMDLVLEMTQNYPKETELISRTVDEPHTARPGCWKR
jgi:hypothetical protein